MENQEVKKMTEKIYLKIEDKVTNKTARPLRKVKAAVIFGFIALTAIFAANLFTPKVKGNAVNVPSEVSGSELF